MGNRTHSGQVVNLRDTADRLVDVAATRCTSPSTGGPNRADAAAIQTALIETDAVTRGGMVSAFGTGGGNTTEVDDRLDDLVRRAGDIGPADRPSLDELVDRFGLLPFEQAITSHNTSPHRYTWYGLEIEKGAQHASFTLSHGEPATSWMYLFDPSGNEVRPTSADVVAWSTGSGTYEVAAVARPAAGQWLVIAVRLDRGATLPSKAIAAIDHRQVTVFGEALRHGAGCPVEFRAGACFVEPLTDLTVAARVRRPGGPWHDVRLADDARDGHYRGWADLPDGGEYSGYIEIRAPERPRVANVRRGPEPAPLDDESCATRAETSGFLRHVPVSVVLPSARVPSGIVPEREEHAPLESQPSFDRRRRNGARREPDAVFESPNASMR